MAWVFDHSRAEGIDRLVLLVLANHYNRETGRCNPGYRRVARESGLGRSTIGRAVGRLVALGELAVVESGAGHRPTKYHFPWLVDNGPSVPEWDAGGSLASRETRLASHDPPPSVPLAGQNPKTEPEPRAREKIAADTNTDPPRTAREIRAEWEPDQVVDPVTFAGLVDDARHRIGRAP